MEVVYPCCCGLDVHKKSITACVLWAEAKGKSRKQKKRFGTFTHDLLQLADWLEHCGVTHVAMMPNSGVLTPEVMGMTPPPFSTATPIKVGCPCADLAHVLQGGDDRAGKL